MAEQVIAPPQSNTVSFENFLLEKNFLTEENLIKARAESTTAHRNLFDYLVGERFITEEDLTKARGLFFNLPYIDLRNKSVPGKVLETVSKESIQNYKFVPFELMGGVLKVAVTDPTNLSALEALEFLAQKQSARIEV